MVKLKSIEDYMTLPKTKLNISQPAEDDVREDAMDTGVNSFNTTIITYVIN